MTDSQLNRIERACLLVNYAFIAFGFGFAVTLAVRHFIGSI